MISSWRGFGWPWVSGDGGVEGLVVSQSGIAQRAPVSTPAHTSNWLCGYIFCRQHLLEQMPGDIGADVRHRGTPHVLRAPKSLQWAESELLTVVLNDATKPVDTSGLGACPRDSARALDANS